METNFNQRETLKINNNFLEIGNVNAEFLAKKYKTPLYVMDKSYIKSVCNAYINSLNENYGYGMISYASKAFCCKEIYRVISNLNMGADVVSYGELYTALSTNFDSSKLIFHGNNKTYSELDYAIKNNIGIIVIDCFDEISIINEIASKYNKIQNVLIRVNPGVEAHTHHYIQTATQDSKFGFSISDTFTIEIIKKTLNQKNLCLKGLHCHIGSQIFDKTAFLLAVDKMTTFYSEVKKQLNIDLKILDLGGGFGIFYSNDDKKLSPNDYYEFVKEISKKLLEDIKNKNIEKPFLILEPGRSIVGEAGITLYTVGSIKQIKGIKNYINIDGGMFENPRFALYQAKYTVIPTSNYNRDFNIKYSVAGKCCESGDLICENIMLPEIKKGDILAVLSTGAYNYSMASNYNRNFVPAVVFVENGLDYLAVKRQTEEDITKNDL